MSLRMTSLRKKAQAAGETMYFTGKPCLRGHIDRRFTKNGGCTACHKMKTDEWRLKNQDRLVSYRKENRTRDTEQARKWRFDNPDRVVVANKKWRQSHPDKVNLRIAKRNAAKLQRTPEWLTPVDLFEMECVYTYCSALRKIGLNYHVDHIVPLRGKIVSGLHVPSNLQVITGTENVRKGNSYGV